MTELLTGSAPYLAGEGEDYMNDRQKTHFRTILAAWKQELMEEGRRAVSNMQDEPLNLPDPNDRASQEEEFTINLRARDRERKLIHKIDKALERLNLDEYGYCEACGVEIGLRRLEARPTAELCIDCKHLEEQREKSQAA
ncbi:MAG: RNA polymerase-binding protein DksA [Candidatus Competibacteraceae bacterium]|nr:RNA polymerase-binding protein DksA [Candidatus Competibacteraceae bacterium]MBK7983612.1 RNA polymerase-binding protein DksA [Candidatus Competibacteraceae bacterium]MBK8897848.1 RNA polymerase-binding protein DksA [Candidatus Competibacteraceae bacterium]MBK8961651.1 RNA polymerase-binding protein DksA [Candidatus Competibacteraceae bacterium]MBK9950873.1 RNA polymerase-binding protein DksA [Candidatus Competibacteraceae bacterium]